MVDLVRWLGAQLDTDERIARAVQQPDDLRWRARHMVGEEAEGTVRWDVPGVAQSTHVDPLNKARMEHIAAHDPARVLREIDAKRQILEEFEASLERSKQFRQRAKSGDETDAQKLERSTENIRVLVLLKVVKTLASAYSDREGYAEALASYE